MILLNEWAFAPGVSFRDRCFIAAENTYDGLELVFADYASARPDLSAAEAQLISRAAARAGVMLRSICTEPLSVGPGSPGHSAQVQRLIEVADRLNITSVIVNPGTTDLDFQQWLEEIAAPLAAAASIGITLRLENGAGLDLFRSPSDLDTLGGNLSLAADFVHLDYANAVRAGCADEWKKSWPTTVGSVHLKGFDSATNAEALFGEGDIDWSSAAVALRGSQIQNATIEHSFNLFGDQSINPKHAESARAWLKMAAPRQEDGKR